MLSWRHDETANYRSLYNKGKIYRSKINYSLPSLQPSPECWDICITKYCRSDCPYCYMNGNQHGVHAENAVKKILDFFGEDSISPSDKPYYVTLGGGEPTSHPDFYDIILAFKKLRIDVTFSTNGHMIMTPHAQIHTEFVKEYCLGVAVTKHNHLQWERALQLYLDARIQTSLHYILTDSFEDIDEICELWKKYSQYENFKALLILPQVALGRSTVSYTGTYFPELVQMMQTVGITNKFGFGAQMFPFIQGNEYMQSLLDMHEPEFYTRYLNLITMKQYKNSFEDIELCN